MRRVNKSVFVRKQRISFALHKLLWRIYYKDQYLDLDGNETQTLTSFKSFKRKTKCCGGRNPENPNPLEATTHPICCWVNMALSSFLLMCSFYFLIFTLLTYFMPHSAKLIFSLLFLLQSLSLLLPLLPCSSLSSTNGWVWVLLASLFKTGFPKGAQRFLCMAELMCSVA